MRSCLEVQPYLLHTCVLICLPFLPSTTLSLHIHTSSRTLTFSPRSRLTISSLLVLIIYYNSLPLCHSLGFPRWLQEIKKFTCSEGDTSWIPGSGSSSGGELQPTLVYALENPMDSEPGATVHKVARDRHDCVTEHALPQCDQLLFLCLFMLNPNPVLKFSLTLFLPLKSYDSFLLIFHLHTHFLLQNL